MQLARISRRQAPVLLLAIAALMLALLCASAQAQQCYIQGAFGMNFGTVSSSGRAASSTLSYTCAPDYANPKNTLYYQICIFMGPGSSSAGQSTRRMTNYNGAYLNYDLYADSARTQIIGAPGSSPVYQIFTMVAPGAPQTVQAPIHGWVYAGQTVPAVYPFQEQQHQGLLRYRYSTSAFPKSADCSSGGMGGASVSFNSSGVYAAYENRCTVVATDLNFGSVIPPQSPVQQKSTIRVQCPAGTPWKVGLDNGLHFDGNMRRMAGANGFVKYQLYKDESHSAVWENSANSMLDGATGSNGGVVSLVVYGEVPAQPNAQMGSFADTIVVTLHY